MQRLRAPDGSTSPAGPVPVAGSLPGPAEAPRSAFPAARFPLHCAGSEDINRQLRDLLQRHPDKWPQRKCLTIWLTKHKFPKHCAYSEEGTNRTFDLFSSHVAPLESAARIALFCSQNLPLFPVTIPKCQFGLLRGKVTKRKVSIYPLRKTLLKLP